MAVTLRDAGERSQSLLTLTAPSGRWFQIRDMSTEEALIVALETIGGN
jgi:hypothetical protein